MATVGFITLARVIVILCQLLSIKLATHYLSLEGLGFYYFLVTVSYFGNALLFAPLDYFQQASLHEMVGKTGGIRPLARFNLRLFAYYGAACSVVLAGVFVAAPRYLTHAVLTMILALALHAVQSLRNTLNNLGHKVVVAGSFIQEAVIRIGTLLALAFAFKADERTLILASIVSLLLCAAVLAWQAYRRGLFRAGGPWEIRLPEVLRFSYPISVSALANWVQLQGYRLMLVPLGFAEVVGLFGTVSNLGSTGMTATATVYSQAFSPGIYKSRGAYTATYLRNALILTGVILIGVGVFGKLAVGLVTNATFVPYWWILGIGVLTEACNLLIGGMSIHVSLTGQTRAIMHSALVGIVGFVVSFGLLYFWGRIGVHTVGIPLLLSQLLVLIYLYRGFRRCAIG